MINEKDKDYFDAGKLGSQLKTLVDQLYGYLTDRNAHAARLISLEISEKTLGLYIKLGEIIQKGQIRPPTDPQPPPDRPDYR